MSKTLENFNTTINSENSVYKRNLELELQIDKELALRCKPGICGFLSCIEEYLHSLQSFTLNNQTLGRGSYNDLAKVIQTFYNNITYEHESFLSFELQEYFLNIKSYASELKNQYVKGPHCLDSIMNEVNELMTPSVSSISDFIHRVNSHSWLNQKFDGSREVEGNLELLINKGKIRLLIIFNIKSIKLNPFYDFYLFFVSDFVNDSLFKELIDNNNSILGLFSGRENKYLYDTSIISDASRSLNKLKLLIEKHFEQYACGFSEEHIAPINKVENRLEEINYYYDRYGSFRNKYSDNSRGLINSIKLIRKDFLKLMHVGQNNIWENKAKNEIRETLERSRTQLLVLVNRLDTSINFDDNLISCLNEIKRNNTLYLLSKNKNKQNEEGAFTPFNEENLSGVIASNLRSAYRTESHVSVHTELFIGCGRTDITVKSHNKIMGHIEFKLLKKLDDVKAKTIDGLFQVFDRYSENDGLDNRFHTCHYLVLFAHDKRILKFIEKINEGIQHFVSKENLSLELLNDFKSENRFSFNLTQSREPLSDKVREITVVVCNLEVDHQSRKAELKRRSNYRL